MRNRIVVSVAIIEGPQSTICTSKFTPGYRSITVKAAEEKRWSMTGQTEKKLTLLHYNDVYNVESREVEPVGGAPRFLTALKSFQDLNPLILFSGDIFAPSLSKFLK